MPRRPRELEISSHSHFTAQAPDTAQPGTRSASADLLLLTAATLWGLNYSIVKFGLSEIAPLAFPVFRFGVGGIVLLVILRLREGSVGVRREDLPLLILVGFFGITLSQISFVFALTNTSASDTALLGATAPIVTALLAAAVGLERMGRRHWLAVCIGLVGVVLIVVGGASGAKLGSNLLGDGLALGSVIVSTVSVLPIRPLLARYSAHRILAYEMLIGTVILAPFAVPGLLAQDYAGVTLAGWGCLAYAVIFSGILASLLYFTAVGRVGPSRAAVYGYLQSFLAVLFAVILLGEHITILQVVGGIVVVGSIVFGRSKLGQRQPRASIRPRAVHSQRRDRAVAAAEQEIAFPVPGHGAVGSLSGTGADVDRVPQLALAIGRSRRARPMDHAARAQVPGQLLPQRATRLHEQRYVDRFRATPAAPDRRDTLA